MAKTKKTETANEPVKYEAIEDFRDLQDDGKVYFAGDRYPNPANKKISEERLNELLSKDNKRNKPVIKEI